MKTLKEMRTELFKVIDNLEYTEFNETDSRIDKIEHIEDLIKNQDFEFIKQLKEKFCTCPDPEYDTTICGSCSDIDKIIGELE